MTEIKICFVSLYAYHLFNPKNNSRFGGAELQLYYLASSLAADPDFKVNFIVGDFGQPKIEEIRNVRLYKFYNPKRKIKFTGLILGLFRLWKLLSRINANLYIQRAAGLETGIVALYCLVYHKKFVYMSASDFDLGENMPPWMSGIQGYIRWKLFLIGLKKADMVIVQHKIQAEALKENYGRDSLIRNSAHPIAGNIDLTNKNFCLWVGRADAIKLPELFLKLVSEFPGEKFVMVMPESSDPLIFERIKNSVNNFINLKYIEFVPISEINQYFEKAKIFINTSKAEGFPNTFVQSLKNKTPILSLNVDPDGMLEKYKMGICAHGDFERLKSGFKKFLEDDQSRIQMGENGYKYAKENHDLQKIVEKDKELIRRLVQTKS